MNVEVGPCVIKYSYSPINNLGDLEQRKTSLRRIEMELDEADEWVGCHISSVQAKALNVSGIAQVSEMEITIQAIPRSIKRKYQARLKAIKAELLRCKNFSTNLHSQLARSVLLASDTRLDGSPSSDEPYGSSGDRVRLLNGMDFLAYVTKADGFTENLFGNRGTRSGGHTEIFKRAKGRDCECTGYGTDIIIKQILLTGN